MTELRRASHWLGCSVFELVPGLRPENRWVLAAWAITADRAERRSRPRGGGGSA